MPAQAKPICSTETVSWMRRTVQKFTGQVGPEEVMSLCDSHEELRRILVEIVESSDALAATMEDGITAENAPALNTAGKRSHAAMEAARAAVKR